MSCVQHAGVARHLQLDGTVISCSAAHVHPVQCQLAEHSRMVGAAEHGKVLISAFVGEEKPRVTVQLLVLSLANCACCRWRFELGDANHRDSATCGITVSELHVCKRKVSRLSIYWM